LASSTSKVRADFLPLLAAVAYGTSLSLPMPRILRLLLLAELIFFDTAWLFECFWISRKANDKKRSRNDKIEPVGFNFNSWRRSARASAGRELPS